MLTVAFFLFFPLISRMVNIMTGNPVAQRTAYSQYLFLPVLIWLFFNGLQNVRKEKLQKGLIVLAILLSVVILWNNALFSNYGFLYQEILYERTVYHVGQVL